VVDVMRENSLALDTPLGELNDAFTIAGVTIPEGAKSITVASFMTHTSGLYPDLTQGTFLFNRHKARTNNAKISRNALSESGRRGTFGDYAYNNGNYAVLGALLEGLTGTDNVTSCRDRLFPQALRTTAGFNDEWISFAAMGGWEASAADYLGFVMQNFGPNTPIAIAPFDTPHQQVADGIYYGTGTIFRHSDGQSTIWHTGAICNFGFFDQGSYFAQYPNGYADVDFEVVLQTSKAHGPPMRMIISFAALFLSAALLQFSSGGVGPLDALTGLSIGFSKSQVGFLGSAHFLGFFIGCWWAPRLMGNVGHSRAFAVFTAMGAIGMAAHVVVSDPNWWALFRIASGVCVAGCYTVIEAWLQAKVTNETRGRAMGTYRIVDMGSR